MAHLSNSIFREDEIMSQPYVHVSQKGPEKNNVLARIWRAFNFWYDCPKEKRVEMAKILDDLLSVAYLMDDVIDNSELRRGLPTANRVFGLQQTLYGIIYATVDAFEKLLDFDEHKETLSDVFIEICLDIHQNQAMTLYYKENLVCPTYEEHAKFLCSNAWIPFSIKMLQLYGKNKLPDFSSILITKIGSFAQIYNDFINLQSPKYFTMRSFCDDVTEGKFSFLVVHAVQSHPQDKRILKIMKGRPTDIESKKRYVNILKELGSFEFAKETLKKLRNEIFEKLEELYVTRNPYMEKSFDDVLENLESDGEIYFDVFLDANNP